MAQPPQPSPSPDRRSFLAQAGAFVIGGALALAAPLAGLGVLLDPLRRQPAGGGAVRVAPLTALPEDGVPRKFDIVATRVDAWNRTPNARIGAVYLQRTKDRPVRAFSVVCPHAGGFVDFHAEKNCYLCPIHNSTFALDGTLLDPKSPAPRGLDELEAEVRGEEIWVVFKNFRPGVKERVPV
ncbi:MAG: Rieske (2Fe-2S) protein [Verrucomicrobiota bacterium]